MLDLGELVRNVEEDMVRKVKLFVYTFTNY